MFEKKERKRKNRTDRERKLVVRSTKEEKLIGGSAALVNKFVDCRPSISC